MNNIASLSLKQIFVIKGIAITMIVMHNYVHSISGIGENEMNYDSNILPNLINLIKINPDALLTGLFSYFGHFGVQLFIFVSGYGLTKQYMTYENINFKKYILKRIVKIYSLLIFGLLILFFGTILIESKEQIILFPKDSLRSLLMLNNFSYDKLYSFVGPWWFFGLIIQLYFIFPFVLKIIKQHKSKGFYILLSISFLLIFLLFPLTESLGFPLFANLPGHLPEFILGIAAALFIFKINYKWFIGGVFIFILSNISGYFFPLSFLSITIVLLFFSSYILNLPEGSYFIKTFRFIGEISMFIFIINGPLRKITLWPFSGEEINHLLLFGGAIAHTLITIVVAYFMSIVYKKCVIPISNKIL